MSQCCLVSGGAGFIGSHLVAALVNRGDQVRVLDNFSSGHRENLAPWKGQIAIIEGDIRDEEAVREGLKGVDIVFHLAALVSVSLSLEKPLLYEDVNTKGLVNLLKLAHQAGVQRFVFSSSSAVYGDHPAPQKRESLFPKPVSPYGLQKLCGEHYLRIYHQLYGMANVSLRYFNVFGPRQSPDSDYAAVIPKFVARMAKGQSPIIFGDGLQSRDFVFVEDVVQANLLAAESEEEAWGKVFNVARGEAINLRELVDTLNGLLETALPAQYEAPRPGDIKESLADISMARQVLGYHPRYSFEEGLKKTIGWFRE